MITKNTVLILGAGASAPYGYPVGKNFKGEILSNLNNEESRSELKNIYSFSDEFIDNFRDAFRYSGKDSIDQLLEFRTEYLIIGKAVITQVIKQHERLDFLFDADDWYSYVYNSYLSSSFDEFDQNKLSFITFNYDRSLETFFFESLKNSYNKSEQDIYQKLSKIPIIHLHGQIGLLPWQSVSNSRAYEASADASSFKESASQIRVIHETGVDKDVVFKEAYNLLQDAEQVVFLGFGYNEVNLRRLRIKTLGLGPDSVTGTCYKLTDKEIHSIEKMTGNKLNLSIDGIMNTYKIKDFLRHYVAFN